MRNALYLLLAAIAGIGAIGAVSIAAWGALTFYLGLGALATWKLTHARPRRTPKHAASKGKTR